MLAYCRGSNSENWRRIEGPQYRRSAIRWIALKYNGHQTKFIAKVFSPHHTIPFYLNMVLAVVHLRKASFLRWTLSTLLGTKARVNERFRTKNSSQKAIRLMGSEIILWDEEAYRSILASPEKRRYQKFGALNWNKSSVHKNCEIWIKGNLFCFFML